jgi:glycine/D-amino acid oxidase-like deaminating enzyme
VNADVAVIGTGPIGASTAWQLASAGQDVLLVGPDPARSEDPRAAYRSSGGSVCWFRPDPAKAERIRRTAEFVTDRVAAGAPIRCRSAPYLFLDVGVCAPALNVNAGDLVADLARLATGAGARRADVGTVHSVRSTSDGHEVAGEGGSLTARVVLLALGAGNPALVRDLRPVLEKRQLFVLDLTVGPDRIAWPHLVLPVGDGYAYLFVKELDEGMRLVLGQEDLVADDDLTGPVDHFAELLDAGVADRLPFLRAAAVERIMWGVDWADKHPQVLEHAPGLFTVNCGSAVRSCVAVGAESAAALTAALR